MPPAASDYLLANKASGFARRGPAMRTPSLAMCLGAAMSMAAGCTTVAQVTTMSEPACRETVAAAFGKILEAQDERPAVAAQLATSATRALASYDVGPRPFLVQSPSGADYSFFVQRDGSACLLRLFGKQKGSVSYTNNMTYIATEPLASCRCAE